MAGHALEKVEPCLLVQDRVGGPGKNIGKLEKCVRKSHQFKLDLQGLKKRFLENGFSVTIKFVRVTRDM